MNVLLFIYLTCFLISHSKLFFPFNSFSIYSSVLIYIKIECTACRTEDHLQYFSECYSTRGSVAIFNSLLWSFYHLSLNRSKGVRCNINIFVKQHTPYRNFANCHTLDLHEKLSDQIPLTSPAFSTFWVMVSAYEILILMLALNYLLSGSINISFSSLCY